MYREEHPNPQFFRNDWKNLNGEWDFEIDFSCTGIERKVYEKDSLEKKINVPFCPESKLSGIEYKDFMNSVWYMRDFDMPTSWNNNGRVLLHFGAVDYKSIIYVNKKQVGEHEGGYTSFSLDITDYLVAGKNVVCVYATDNNRCGMQASGKQSQQCFPIGCCYTRTTGIWQTVWLEHTPDSRIESFELYPDIQNCKLSFSATTIGTETLKAIVTYQGKEVGSTNVASIGGYVCGEIILSEKHLWEVGKGRLYDVEFTYGEDKVQSYFGLREIKLDKMKFLLNGKSVFQRLVLDQGFYRDGIYTAPSDEALALDIQLSLDAGFNGARLHEKVFEPRFLYHCDRLGYLVWGEFPNWGVDYSNAENLATYIIQWKESVKRDFNHPSIIGWCPFNETWDYNGRKQWDPLLSTIYYVTKSLDKTRPCIDTSGNYHIVTDIYDVHDYCQDPVEFKKHFEKISEGEIDNYSNRQHYTKGMPFFVSEYGGICCNEDNIEGWGYGETPKDKEEFLTRYKGLTDALLDDENMLGFCYTQLYDVEQEVNGIYTYDRKSKFDISVINAINSRKAKIED